MTVGRGRGHFARIVLTGFLAVLLAGCQLLDSSPLQPPAITLQDLQAEALGINSQVFRARLGLFNPNGVPLWIVGGELQLELAGVGAARGQLLEAVQVPAGERAETDIRVSMSLLRDGPALMRVLSAGANEQGLDYSLNGFVQLRRRGFGRIPISSSGRLGLAATEQAGAR